MTRQPGGSGDLTIVLVYPDLLGLYGDRGNALTLAHRARARGIGARVLPVAAGEPVPSDGDIYLVGGGEDAPMLLAGSLLAGQAGLRTALEAGRPCLAVCAGFQLLSESYAGPDDQIHAGLGLLDATCRRLDGNRAVGEVVLRPTIDTWGSVNGFENHRGDARLGAGVRPLGTVLTGVGNGHDHVEGALTASIVATYLHGPVLVRNPDIADHLIGIAVGGPLAPLDEAEVNRLRRERLTSALSSRIRRLARPRSA